MVSPVQLGSEISHDFLNYCCSELQKVISFYWGDEADENSTLPNDSVFCYGSAGVSFFAPGSRLQKLDFDFQIFPDMPEGYSITSGYRPNGEYYGYGADSYISIAQAPCSFKAYASGTQPYFLCSSGSVDYYSYPIKSYDITGNFLYNFSPPLIVTSFPSFGGIYTGDTAHPVFSFGDMRVSGSNAVYFPASSPYSYKEVYNVLVDVPNYTPPTWDDLIRHDIIIPDFYPSQLPNLVLDTEIPFNIEVPERVGETVTNILESSLSFLSGTGLLTFLCVICLLRIFIYKFKKE